MNISRKFLSKWFIVMTISLNAFSQNSDQSNSDPGTVTSNNTAISNYLNISSGDVTYSVSLNEVFGLGLVYSSALAEGVDEPNSTVATGITGLGWSFNTPVILCDHKNTGTRIDDEFYLSEGGGVNLLHCIDKNSQYNEFVSSDINTTKIYYYYNDERWELVKDDGTTLTFGGKNNGSNSIVNAIKLGNWMGDSPTVTDDQGNVVQEHLATSWYLSSISSIYDDITSYEYYQQQEKVCSSMLPGMCSLALSYTKAIYLVEVKNSQGMVVLQYDEKQPDEYYDPYSQQDEPDAYQEWLPTRYLKSIASFNRHGKLLGQKLLDYDFFNQNEKAKRVLKSITDIRHSGEADTTALPADSISVTLGGDTIYHANHQYSDLSYLGEPENPMRFEYYQLGRKKGFLKEIVYPTGFTTSYEYDSLELSINNGQLYTEVESPGANYKQPLYKMFGNYMIVCWRNVNSVNGKDVIVDLYEWDTRWNKTPNIATFDNVLYDGDDDHVSYEDFTIQMQDGFFAILHREKLTVFAKDPCKTSGWNLVVDKTLPWGYKAGPYALMAGDKYVAIGDLDGDVYVYTEGRWQEEYHISPNGSDEYYYDYQHNFFVSNSSEQLFRLFLINEAKHWSIQTKTLDIDGKPVCTTNSIYYTQKYTNKQRLAKWNESFDLDSLVYCPLPDNPIGTDFAAVRGVNNLMTLEETTIQYKPYYTSVMVDQYDTVRYFQWNEKYQRWYNNRPLKFYRKVIKKGKELGEWVQDITKHQRKISVTRYSRTNNIGYKYTSFDANTQSWNEVHLEGSDVEPINENTLNIGSSETFIANSKVYHFTGNDEVTLIGDLWDMLSEEATASGVTTYTDFNFDINNAYAGDGFYLLSSDFTDDSYVMFIGKDSLINKVTLSGLKAAWNGTSSDYFLTHLSNEKLMDVSVLYLYNTNDDDIKSSMTHFPVKRIKYNDGFQEYNTRIDYDTAYINVSGAPLYSKVLVTEEGEYGDDSNDYGNTEYQFYNGFELDQFPFEVTQLNGGNASNSPKFKGLPVRTIIRNSMGDTVAMSETSYKIFVKEYFCNGGLKIGEGLAIKPVAEISHSNGLSQKSYTSYDEDTRISETRNFNVNKQGTQLEYITNYFYADSLYPGMYNENLRGIPVQTISSVYDPSTGNTTTLDIEATTWKNWYGDFWAPYESWMWNDDGQPIGFDAWDESQTPSNNWVLTAKVDSLDASGNIVQQTDFSGITTASILVNNREIASVLNAKRQEVYFDNFDHLEYVDWYTSGEVSLSDMGTIVLSHKGAPGLCTSPFQISTGYIVEFDGKLDANAPSSAWLGFQFFKSNEADDYQTSGFTLKILPSGYLELYESGVGTLLISTNAIEVADWHHYTMAHEAGKLKVFVDGVLVFEHATTNIHGSKMGFAADNARVDVDNIAAYPASALMKSGGYDPVFGMSKSRTSARGTSEHYIYDDRMQGISVLNSIREPVSAGLYAYSVDHNNGTFSNLDPDLVLKTRMSGFSYADDFSYRRPQWQVLNAGCGNWIFGGGTLEFSRNPSYCSGNEILNMSVSEAISNRVAIRFDAKGDSTWTSTSQSKFEEESDSTWTNELTIAFGDSSWNGQNLSAGFHVKYNVILDTVWSNFIIVLDYNSQTYQVFKNGKIQQDRQPFNQSGTELIQLSLFDQTSGNSANFEMDNFFVYSDFITSISYDDAGGSTRQSQMEAGSGRVLVSQTIYDEVGRPLIGVRPSEVYDATNPCYLCYRPGYASFDWQTQSLSGEVVALNPLDSGYAFTRKKVENSPLGRVLEESVNFGAINKVGGPLATKYLTGTPSQFDEISELPTDDYFVQATYLQDSLSLFKVVDQSGNLLFSKIGKVKTGSLFSSAAADQQYITSSYDYNSRGELTSLYPPAYYLPTTDQDAVKEQFVSTTSYDHFGRVIERQSSDMGKLRSIYDARGNLRFVQDSAGMKGIDFFDLGVSTQQYIIYTKYDDLGNIIETGYSNYTWDREELENKADDGNWPQAEYLQATIDLRFDGDDPVNFSALSSSVSNETSYSGSSSIKLSNESSEIFLPINIPSSINISAMSNTVGSGQIEVYYLSQDSSFIRNYQISGVIPNAGWQHIEMGTLIASNKGVLKLVLKSSNSDVYFDNLKIVYTSLHEVETWYQKNEYFSLEGNFYERGLLKQTVTNNGWGEEEELVTTQFRYDREGRIISKSQKIGSEQTSFTTVHYEYDKAGGLLRTYVTDQTAWNEIGYLDGDSSVLVATTKNFSADKALTATDGFEIVAGSTVEIFPGGPSNPVNPDHLPNITYHYDDVGRLVGIGNDTLSNYYASYQYDSRGNISLEQINGGNISSHYIYDHQDQLSQIFHENYFTEDIDYDRKGLITSATYTIEEILSSKTPYVNDNSFTHYYSYDEIGRLLGVNSNLASEYNMQADYDANGNFINSTSNDVNKNYSYYPGTNRVKSIMNASSQEYQYDPNGNVVSNANKNLSIDYNRTTNRTTAVTSDSAFANYQYGAGKSKVFKEGNDKSKTSYLNDLNGKSLMEKYSDWSANHTRYIVTGPHGIIAIVIDGQPYFLLRDHLGSPLAIVDQYNEPVLIMYYGPHGHTNEKYISADASKNIAYQFTGQENEKQLGIYNYGSRMYDPDLGQFYAIDPAEQFPGLNPYMGMGNNPLIFVDPDGEFVLSLIIPGLGAFLDAMLWGAVIGAGASSAVYTTTYFASGQGGSGGFWKGFGKAAAIGAITGAISGGIGHAGGALANNIGFEILNNTTSTIAGNTILGNDVSLGTVVGSVAGGVFGQTLPKFGGVKGGFFANSVAEIGYGALKGGLTGGVTGGVKALVDNEHVGRGITSGAFNGFVGGATISGLKLATLGPVVNKMLTEEERQLILSETGISKLPTLRKGHFHETGIAIGANSSFGESLNRNVFKNTDYVRANWKEINRANWIAGLAHEVLHVKQMYGDGFALFYGRQFIDYLNGHRTNGFYEKPAYKLQLRLGRQFGQ